MRPTCQGLLRAFHRGLLASVICLCSLEISAAGSAAHSAEKDDIVWALTPLPPAMLETNGEITGYGVDILDWFADQLPQYTHRKEIVPLARLLQTITGPGTFCNIGMNPTPERQQILHFTDAVLPHLPVSLIVDAARDHKLKPFLTDNGQVDLDLLITEGKLDGGLRSKRSYGPFIDRIVQNHPDNPRISQIGNDANFLQLIALGRMDWTLYLPAEAEYHRRTKLPDTVFSSWQIAGNDQLMPASIACSKNATGENIVTEINDLVRKHPEMPWAKFYSSSLSDADQIRYQQALKRYVADINNPQSVQVDQ
ncbi:MAG: transporter substrate-binding domain-containing protein [Thalassospira sp.]|uniref:transporter substrate-binding domain-containing protein n=1 Tax=Thalassospira sp. TaxID=1912094 RepID=UPI0032EBBE66